MLRNGKTVDEPQNHLIFHNFRTIAFTAKSSLTNLLSMTQGTILLLNLVADTLCGGVIIILSPGSAPPRTLKKP